MHAGVEDSIGEDRRTIVPEHLELHLRLLDPGHGQVGYARAASMRQTDPRVSGDAVAKGRRRVTVDGSEVAAAVDQRFADGEVLGHADQRVVDGGVAVRVVLLHHVADDRRALAVLGVGPQPRFVHRVEDPPLHGLQAVADVWEGPAHDDAHGVVEERLLHPLGDVDVDDVAVVQEGSLRAHAPSVASRCDITAQPGHATS